MRYGITKEATDFTDEVMSDWHVRLIKAIFFFIPRANRDNEALFPQVRSWAIELDDVGWPQREIGLNSEGKPLFAAPNERNTGFWPDMAAKQFQPGELQEISELEFNNMWSALHAGA